ncbi:MAG: hypothetical protein U1F53_11030 [Burkholderiaceae bacterium]
MSTQALLAAPALLVAAMAQASPATTTLYANTGTDSGLGVLSQAAGGFVAEAADDFTVPAGEHWTITEVDVTGVYFNGSGPADAQGVTIYRASHGRVGEVVARYPRLAGVDNGGSFRIAIPKTRLRPGVYYVSVVVDMAFGAGGEWHWENLLEVHGHHPRWQNPGGGVCQTWTREKKCFGPGLGDHFFALQGYVD